MTKSKKKIVKTIPNKIPTKHIVVYDAIFQQQVDVLMNYTLEKYEKWLNRNKIKDITLKDYDSFTGWVSDYVDEKGITKRILFIPKFEWLIKHQGTLIHEITHVIIKIWAMNNIHFNAETQEFLAHSIGNMYEDIARKLLQVKKVKR